MVRDESIFTHDIYLVIYHMKCFPLSEILSGLLVSGLVLVEVC